MSILFDSRDSRCKTPFGAAKTGEPVCFTIFLPKRLNNAAPQLKLTEIDDWETPIVLLMDFSGADLVSNWFTCIFTPEKPCVYVYYFQIFSDNYVQSLKRGEDGRGTFSDDGHLWQLTVYDAAMKAPGFLREGVMYQIFPDRFANSGREKSGVPGDRRLRSDWGALPDWRPDHKGEVTNSDYFGGDLRGIEDKLDYLQSLGITALYLNPIFEAHANHRYNTADYSRVDPLLGDNSDFRSLCAAAKKKGISIILDGVFSHTGSDSVYFNRNRRYGDGGAFNDPDSPYRQWYNFLEYPGKYDSWWGFITLPNVNETEPGYLDFICGDKGILHQWLDRGAAGFRLDVADELPDAFLDALHNSVKGYNVDCAIIGEVWEDASNKQSYGVRRRYLQGGQLDSVMNYPFQEGILNYVRWGNHQVFYDVLMQILENYPKPSIQALMNFLSTHDTVRAITALVGPLMEQNGREWQEQHHYLPPDQYQHGCKLFLLASILQFGLPGIPCVYYGDEAGLCGYRDPFNRVCYPWGKENETLLSFIRQLGKVRTDYPIFAEAEFLPITFSREVCSFARVGETAAILFAINRSHNPAPLNLPAEFQNAATLVQAGGYENQTLGAFSGVVLKKDI